MSQEYQNLVDGMQRDVIDRFVSGLPPAKRHVECRIAGAPSYAYLYEDGAHVQTQQVALPARWDAHPPSDSQVTSLHASGVFDVEPEKEQLARWMEESCYLEHCFVVKQRRGPLQACL